MITDNTKNNKQFFKVSKVLETIALVVLTLIIIMYSLQLESFMAKAEEGGQQTTNESNGENANSSDVVTPVRSDFVNPNDVAESTKERKSERLSPSEKKEKIVGVENWGFNYQWLVFAILSIAMIFIVIAPDFQRNKKPRRDD